MYSIKETNVSGNYKEDDLLYDLVNVVILNLAKTNISDCTDVIKVLNLLFIKNNSDSINLTNTLKKKYNINVNDTEVAKMWDMSSGIEQMYLEEGIEKGIEKGAILMAKSNIEHLMSNYNMPFDEAVSMLGISNEIKEQIKANTDK